MQLMLQLYHNACYNDNSNITVTTVICYISNNNTTCYDNILHVATYLTIVIINTHAMHI